MSDRVKGACLTMGGAACWGVSGCMGQDLFTREGMDSTWLVPIRLFLAGLILSAFFFVKDRKMLFDPWNFKKNPRNVVDLLIYGLAGVSCCQFTYFLTIQLSSAGMGTILQDLSPVIILLVVCIQQRRGPRVFEIFSILLALVGVFLITTHGSLTDLAISPAALASGVVSACCVAIQEIAGAVPNPDAAGLGVLDGRHDVCPDLPPLDDELCADADGRVRYFHGRGAGQCAGVQPVYVGCAAHRPAEVQPVQLCGAGHGGYYQHLGVGLAVYAVGCPGLWLHLFDAGAVESAGENKSVIDSRGCPQWAAFFAAMWGPDMSGFQLSHKCAFAFMPRAGYARPLQCYNKINLS